MGLITILALIKKIQKIHAEYQDVRPKTLLVDIEHRLNRVSVRFVEKRITQKTVLLGVRWRSR